MLPRFPPDTTTSCLNQTTDLLTRAPPLPLAPRGLFSLQPDGSFENGSQVLSFLCSKPPAAPPYPEHKVEEPALSLPHLQPHGYPGQPQLCALPFHRPCLSSSNELRSFPAPSLCKCWPFAGSLLPSPSTLWSANSSPSLRSPGKIIHTCREAFCNLPTSRWGDRVWKGKAGGLS